jgi:hypothetical protein
MKKYRYYIGIDPGTKTGFALWDSQERKFITIETTDIHIAFEVINNLDEEIILSQTFFRVEDARQRQWFGKAGTEQLQGAGSIKRDCKIWEDFLNDRKANYEMVAPKNNKTKLSSELFERMTKYKGRTSEHGRDAAMLVFAK